MNFIPNQNRRIGKYQQGGEMPPAEQAPEQVQEGPQGGEQDPLMMLAEGAMQALQSQDCQIAMQVCQGLVALIQQLAGSQAQPQQQGEPVFRKGGVLLRRIRK